MTHWLGFSEADFDASRAPRGASKRGSEQPGLFFVATPVKAKRATQAGQLPGQVPLFDDDAAGPLEDDGGPETVCRPNLYDFCRDCGRDMQTSSERN